MGKPIHCLSDKKKITSSNTLDNINSTTTQCTESTLSIKTGPHNLTTDLPPEHCIHVFTNKERLQTAAQTVLDSLTRNECDGNQWILIHDTPKSIISSLDSDKNFLDGINNRFQWEGTTGLTRTIPSAAHGQINADFTALGIHRRDRRWGLSTTLSAFDWNWMLWQAG